MLHTILQVEDDPNDVFLFEHAMRKVGVVNPIQVATDGQQAIDYLNGVGRFSDRKLFPLPCLVLLDLKLPYVMGLDVLKWIRGQTGTSRVVVLLSASGQETDIAAAYRLGANGFLIKPSEASKLQDIARSIRDYWLIQNTPPPEMSSQVPMEGTVSLEIAPANFSTLSITRRGTDKPAGELTTRNGRPKGGS
ncbi:MAG: response regulator [Akkermansiaceae bacterium]|nr:response regulator [Verrucomicrobiales bacterium]